MILYTVWYIGDLKLSLARTLALPLLLHLLLIYHFNKHWHNCYKYFHLHLSRNISSNLETVEFFFKFLYQLFRFGGSLARHLQTICNKFEYLRVAPVWQKQIGTSMISAQQQRRWLCRRLLLQPLLHVSQWLDQDSFNSKLLGKERKKCVLNWLMRQPLNTFLMRSKKFN